MSLAGLLGAKRLVHTWTADGSEVDRLAKQATARGIRLARLSGPQLTTTVAFLDAVASALDFPDYFGRNWDAFDECIADLSWIQETNVLVLVQDAAGFLSSDPEEFRWLLILADDLALQKLDKRVRILLQADAGAMPRLQRRLTDLGFGLPAFTA